MRVEKSVILMVAVLGSLTLAGCLRMFQISQFQPVSLPHTPKPGEETILHVVAFDEDTNAWIETEVMLTDIEAERCEKKITNGEDGAIFSAIVGKQYIITAKYKDSNTSLRFIMKPGAIVVVFIKNKKVVDILIYLTSIM